MLDEAFNRLLDMAVTEDLGNGMDVTSDAIFREEDCTATLISKATGILAGIDFFKTVILRFEPEARLECRLKDGDSLIPGDCIATIRGKANNILKAERTALNFLAFLSGIATGTRQAVNKARNIGRTIILDTRKTLPGYRLLSKYAVKVGGGHNHRMGLYDMVLIKDNHIDAAGGIKQAVARVREKWRDRFKIEIECRDLAEVRQALEQGVDIIMLDNMPPELIKQAVQSIGTKAKSEISGNITLERLQEVVPSGADYVSMGSLTHTVTCFDFSLKIQL